MRLPIRERLAAELKEFEAAFKVFFAKGEGKTDVSDWRSKLDTALAERAIGHVSFI
jgi:hypothetical protein